MSDTEVFDYAAYEGKDPLPMGDNSIARLHGVAQEFTQLENAIANMEEELKDRKDQLRTLKEQTIPELLQELQTGSWTSQDGSITITTKEKVYGSIPKAKASAAHKWLEDNDHGNLIKRTLTISFGKDEESWANKFERDCAQRKKPLNIARKNAVAPQTLLAFVRSELEEGTDLPLDLFGVHRRTEAEVTVS